MCGVCSRKFATNVLQPNLLFAMMGEYFLQVLKTLRKDVVLESIDTKTYITDSIRDGFINSD